MPTYTFAREQRMTVVAETSEQAERIARAYPAWITDSRAPWIAAVEPDPAADRCRFGDVEVDIPAHIIERQAS